MKCYVKDYPRPQFVRGNWENLNGVWKFCFDDKKEGEKEGWYDGLKEYREIQVPFTYETKASGIGEEGLHEYIWYERSLEVSGERLRKERLMLHFEGSDYRTKVWVNGAFIGDHIGGYERFSFDITEAVKNGDNRIVVLVEDSSSMVQPRGKQRWTKENFGCWYIQTTGIWKTVWMEYVPHISLKKVKMTPDLQRGRLEVEYSLLGQNETDISQLEIEAVVSIGNTYLTRTVTKVHGYEGTTVIDLDIQEVNRGARIHTWTPENPELYDIEFRVRYKNNVTDVIGSYFGMRDIRIENQNILLNGIPIYQKLILDQGYWEESHLTPPSEEALIQDIDSIHAMGYNGLRKHQKIEDERFLYWCDVKGMLVWSEAPAAYRFLDGSVEQFTKEWIAIVQQNYNHPSIITWTPFNESWGISEVRNEKKQQHFTESIYHLTKSIDSMRPVIVNDGWEHTISDIITLHDYEEAGEILRNRYMEYKNEILKNEMPHSLNRFAFANGYGYCGQPVIISEFGGIAYTKEKGGWGYGNMVYDEDTFLKRYDAITTAIKEIPYVCGYCYTQITDVQQEVNGLMDMQRNYKVNPEKIRKVNERQVGFWRKNC